MSECDPQSPRSFLLPSSNPEPPPGSLAGRSRALPAPSWKFCAGLSFMVAFASALCRVSTPSQSFSSCWEFAHRLPPTLLPSSGLPLRVLPLLSSTQGQLSSLPGFWGNAFWSPLGFPTGYRVGSRDGGGYSPHADCPQAGLKRARFISSVVNPLSSVSKWKEPAPAMRAVLLQGA